MPDDLDLFDVPALGLAEYASGEYVRTSAGAVKTDGGDKANWIFRSCCDESGRSVA
jgi:hypothetical protein